MTTNLLLRNTAFVCALMLGITSMAQLKFQPYQVYKEFNPLVDQNTTFSTSEIQQANQTLKAPKATGETYTLKINLNYDNEWFEAPRVIDVVNDNYDGYRMTGTFEQSVATGTYHIICTFVSVLGTPYFIIKESVEISSDTTFTLSPEETNHIVLNNYGPDGQLLKHDFANYDNGEIVDEGTIEQTTVLYKIYLKGHGTLINNYSWSFGYPIPAPEELFGSLFDFYITDVSDRFLLTQARICQGKMLSVDDTPIYYINYFSTDNVKVGTLENTPSNYVHQIETFKYSPYGQTQDGFGFGFKFFDTMNNRSVGNHRKNKFYFKPKQGDNYSIETWVNLPYEDPIDNNHKNLFQTFANDYGDGTQPTGWIDSTPMALINGNLMKVNFGHHGGGTEQTFLDYNSLYAVINDNTWIRQLLPAPEAFCYSAEQALGIIGDNCPINALKVETYENNDQINLGITNYFVGRYGETRWCNEGTTATTQFNGTEVDFESFTPEGKGTYEITVTNPNIEVDGLPGNNTTTVYFDQNQEDMTPPSIEMLHFKNGEGGVTDRFATSADGTMEFYASDFDYHYYPELWNGIYEVKPVEVQVEYAPYGTETWNELTVEEVPELFQEPGWGYFYRGSLANVIGQAEKGWFDLKFRFEDAAGNWQEQVVSPAFRIDDLAITGINEITLAHPNDDNTIYNLAGQRVHGDINNLPRGVYIVGGKKVVK